MVNVFKWGLTIALIMVMAFAVFVSYFPIWLSFVLSLCSLVLLFWTRTDRSVAKAKLIDAKNFFIVVFWNFLLLPYIKSKIIQIMVLVLIFIAGMLCVVYIFKEQENRVYFKNAVTKYCTYTIVPGVFIVIIDLFLK